MQLRDGNRLHFELRGDGPPLALIAGLGGVATFWEPHVGELARRFRVVLHDHRGTGRSDRPVQAYSVEQMTADLVELLDALDIERVHVVGHSTGGAIGQALAIDHPSRVGRLVLSATWTRADAYFRRLFETRSAIFQRLGAEAYTRISTLLLWTPEWIRDHPEAVDAAVEQAPALLTPPEILPARIRALLAFDRRDELARIGAPTLVIGARDDMITPYYYSEELAALIPDARLVTFSTGGHFFPITHAEEYRLAVVDFLTA